MAKYEGVSCLLRKTYCPKPGCSLGPVPGPLTLMIFTQTLLPPEHLESHQNCHWPLKGPPPFFHLEQVLLASEEGWLRKFFLPHNPSPVKDEEEKGQQWPLVVTWRLCQWGMEYGIRFQSVYLPLIMVC